MASNLVRVQTPGSRYSLLNMRRRIGWEREIHDLTQNGVAPQSWLCTSVNRAGCPGCRVGRRLRVLAQAFIPSRTLSPLEWLVFSALKGTRVSQHCAHVWNARRNKGHSHRTGKPFPGKLRCIAQGQRHESHVLWLGSLGQQCSRSVESGTLGVSYFPPPESKRPPVA